MMFHDASLEGMRQVFFEAWEKHQKGMVLTTLEMQVVSVIEVHPEYHGLMEGRETIKSGETENPFLHLGLHLAIREQVNTNRPEGVRAIYDALCQRYAPLEVEHLMMPILAEQLWMAQREGKMPDERVYLASLKGRLSE